MDESSAYLSAVAAVILTLIFLVSALTKARRPGLFAERLADFEIVPPAYVPVVAWGVIASELIVAITLITFPVPGGILAATLIAAFSAVVVRALAQGKRAISCGCFGQAKDEPLGLHLLIRNGALLVLAAASASERPAAVSADLVPAAVLVSMFGAVVIVVSEGVRHLELVTRSPAFRAIDRSEEAG